MTDDDTTAGRGRRFGKGAALVTAGVIAGGVLVGTQVAGATGSATPDPSTTSSSTTGSATPGSKSSGPGRTADTTVDESQPQRSDETLLTGTDAEKVTAAALARYPGATVQRVETDSDGVYEAHLVTTDGARVTVQVGADFAVTGVQTGGPGGGSRGGHDGPAADATTGTEGTTGA